MDNKFNDVNKNLDLSAIDSRYEQALAMGVEIPKDGYWGNVPSRICGAVGGAKGGEMVRQAIEDFEMDLAKGKK
ncbi:alpha/beta-type small acid-soluble spore protein [Clostridium omnivorum]|uniref:Small, acid-soluble spore protein, alpha/beta type n=1 Tax=Clostridium omnivorum TaxID=1604902 RepID=A0ABQ5N8H0_9CLOT|nr:alpha/beta-type small acid-soluble spore protein [Clostridium sp. E14]GLC31511.1 hypothetical protein bsdE14_29210 [Clostridium sp. E14]